MNSLGQYYTRQSISELLISKFSFNDPQKIVDIGAGKGALLQAAYQRWRNANFSAVDIDKQNVNYLNTNLSFISNTFHLNSLSPALGGKIKAKIGNFDIAVCNPPYKYFNTSSSIKDILLKAKLTESLKLKKVTSDVVFLAQNICLLKKGGELGIILPDSIFTSHVYEGLREDLVKNHQIFGVIQIPEKMFKKTEAKTHILLLKKNSSNKQKVPIYFSNTNGKISSCINVNNNELIYRMDYDYLNWYSKNKGRESTLKDLDIDLKRGSYTKKDLISCKENYFHTTCFPAGNNIISLKKTVKLNGVFAKKGDILLARVGKRCIGKVTMVKSGIATLSDCVYRLRVPKQYREYIFKEMTSVKGQEWLKVHSHGVCSRVISKKDLLNFPINKIS
jgi:type I restriction enzyme M protein